jgi:hypothetical protein
MTSTAARSWLLMVLLAALLAACGASAVASPSAMSASMPAATPAATTTAEHGAPDLEAMLPATIAGLATTRTSVSGLPSTAGTTTFPPTHDGMAGMLALVNKTPADLQYAMATTSADPSAPVIYVVHVRGVEAGLVAWMSGVSHASLSEVTVGGKRVQVQPGLEATYVIYEKGELLFLIQDLPVADQPAVLAALP